MEKRATNVKVPLISKIAYAVGQIPPVACHCGASDGLGSDPYVLGSSGRAASIFALLTGISMFAMYFSTATDTPVTFYLFSALAQFFFSGFNTAIYAVIPDCVEYGEWKTGLRNDGFQYAFISLGNKVGMAIGTSLLAAVLEMCGYVANQQQNSAVLSVIRHSFTTTEQKMTVQICCISNRKRVKRLTIIKNGYIMSVR